MLDIKVQELFLAPCQNTMFSTILKKSLVWHGREEDTTQKLSDGKLIQNLTVQSGSPYVSTVLLDGLW